jgi:large subunit ribosomal protein L43
MAATGALSNAAQRLRIERVRILFCTFGGSSKGVRSFLATDFIAYAQKHREVEFSIELRKRRHPVAHGLYRNGYERTLELSNMNSSEIKDRLEYLINSLGNKQRTPAQLSYGVLSRSPSIQGMTRVAHISPSWFKDVAERAFSQARQRYGIPSFGDIVDDVGMARATRIFQRVRLLAQQAQLNKL